MRKKQVTQQPKPARCASGVMRCRIDVRCDGYVSVKIQRVWARGKADTVRIYNGVSRPSLGRLVRALPSWLDEPEDEER